MKHILIGLLVCILPIEVLGQPTTANLMGSGMPAQLATHLSESSVFRSNNTWLTCRDAANSANINVLKCDSSDETILNADTGDTILFQVGGTTELTLDNDQITFSGATADIVPGATALRFRDTADAQTNLNITDAGVVTARAGLVATAGGVTATAGNIVMSAAAGGLQFTPGTLAATGTGQGDAAALTAKVTTVTASDAAKGVILPATPTAGDLWIIVETQNAVLLVYPGTGDQINGLGANAAASLAARATLFCIATSASQWWCFEGANA